MSYDGKLDRMTASEEHDAERHGAGADHELVLRGAVARAVRKERDDIITCIRTGHFGASEEIVSMIKRRK